MKGETTYKLTSLVINYNDSSPVARAETARTMHEQSSNPVFKVVGWVIDLF